MQNIMRRIVNTISFDGPNHQHLDDEGLNNYKSSDEEAEGEGNDNIEGLGEESIHLQLDDLDLEIEGDLEGIDGTSIYIDVHACQ
ncbi:hypothetical protein GOP47_0030648 [Adiantum capillus-veneris]|nr:hypothetical protein GOP47_0030648 [Adiantum capillus-veneris]